MAKKVELFPGKNYGHLQIIKELGPEIVGSQRYRQILVQCRLCDAQMIRRSSSLQSGTSCSCTKIFSHNNRIHKIYTDMLENKQWSVCPAWAEPELGRYRFLAWAKASNYANGWEKSSRFQSSFVLTCDAPEINPQTASWKLIQEPRKQIMITINEDEQPLKKYWQEHHQPCVKYSTARSRYLNGWSLQDAVTLPPHHSF